MEQNRKSRKVPHIYREIQRMTWQMSGNRAYYSHYHGTDGYPHEREDSQTIH